MPNELRKQYDALIDQGSQVGIDVELRPSRFPERWEVTIHWTGTEHFSGYTPEEAMKLAAVWLSGYSMRQAEYVRDLELRNERRKLDDPNDST